MLFSSTTLFTDLVEPQPNLYPSSLNLFGTIQFIQAHKTGYFGFSIDDLTQPAKIILQRQAYLLFSWAVLRYCCTLSNRKARAKLKKFNNINPDNFAPNENEIFLYIKNPKFLWRFSTINYKNITKLLNSDNKHIKELEIFTTYGDSSAIVPFIENSGIKADVINFDFKFKFTAYEVSEYLYSDDYHLHLMDEITNYNEFLQIILSGQCKRYKSKILSLYEEEKDRKPKKANNYNHKSTKSMINECFRLIELDKRQIEITKHSRLSSKFDTIRKSFSIKRSKSRSKSKSTSRHLTKNSNKNQTGNTLTIDDGDNVSDSLFLSSYQLPMSGFKYDGFQIPISDDPTKKDLTNLLEFDVSIIKFNDQSIEDCYTTIEKLIKSKYFINNIPENAVNFIGEINQPYPFFTMAYLNILLEKRKAEIIVDKNFLKSPTWNHTALKRKEIHPFSFYRFIYSCYGPKVDVQNSYKIGPHNEALIIYWEPPESDSQFEYYADQYSKLAQENKWVSTYSARLKKSSEEWSKFQTDCRMLIRHYKSMAKLENINNLKNDNVQQKNNTKRIEFKFVPPLLGFKENKLGANSDINSVYANDLLADKVYDYLMFNRLDVFNKNYAKICKSKPEYFGKLRKYMNTGKFRNGDIKVNAFIRKSFIIDDGEVTEMDDYQKCSHDAEISKLENNSNDDKNPSSDIDTIINEHETGIIEQDDDDDDQKCSEVKKDIDIYSIDAFSPINPYFINPVYPNPEQAPLNPYMEYILDIDHINDNITIADGSISSCNSTVGSSGTGILNIKTGNIRKPSNDSVFKPDSNPFEIFEGVHSSSSFYPSDV